MTGSKTEAGKDRIITISPKLKEIIEEQMNTPGPWLFPRLSDGQQMKVNYFAEKFKVLTEKLGIQDRVPYSCRHTFANLLKAVQGSDTDKAALMGHANASMTKYYQEPDYESLRSITDRI